MNRIYLVRHDATQNMHWFYQLLLTPTLLGEWLLIREWGKMGTPNSVKKKGYTIKDNTDYGR